MIKFISDKARISGPRYDGSMTISFEVGEYEKKTVLEIMKHEPPFVVEVEKYEEEK